MVRVPGAVLLALALLAVPSMPLAAQEGEPVGPVVSDRPGLGDGAHVLATGVWQVEAGAQFLSGPVRRYSFGQGLIRRGFDPLELRIYVNSLVVDGGAGSDIGLEDLGVGVKVPLSSGGWDWSTVGVVTFPTGGNDFSAREVTAAGTLIGETALTDAVGLALNAGYAFPVQDPGDGAIAVILTPGFAISAVPGLSAYAGVASYLDHGPDRNYVEAGLAYLRDTDVQIDLNWGVETDSRDWFLGIGFARRWR